MTLRGGEDRAPRMDPSDNAAQSRGGDPSISGRGAWGVSAVDRAYDGGLPGSTKGDG
jgi:hypothetical protein